MDHGVLVRLSLTQRMHSAVVRLVRGCRAEPLPTNLDALLVDAVYDLVQLLEPNGSASEKVFRVTLGPGGHQTATSHPRPLPIPQLVRDQAERIRGSRRTVSPLPFDPAYPTAHEAAVDLAERVSVAVCQAVGTPTLLEAFDELEFSGRWSIAVAAVRPLAGLNDETLPRITDQLPSELLHLQREAAHFTNGVLHLADVALTKLHEHEKANDGLVLRCDTLLRVAPDYSMVRQGDEVFTFYTKQIIVVQTLVESWEAGYGEMSRAVLCKAAGSRSGDLRSLFRPNGRLNPAWNTLIIPVQGKKGVYRLGIAPPAKTRFGCS